MVRYKIHTVAYNRDCRSIWIRNKKTLSEKDAGDEPPENFEIHLKNITNRNGYFKNPHLFRFFIY